MIANKLTTWKEMNGEPRERWMHFATFYNRKFMCHWQLQLHNQVVIVRPNHNLMIKPSIFLLCIFSMLLSWMISHFHFQFPLHMLCNEILFNLLLCLLNSSVSLFNWKGQHHGQFSKEMDLSSRPFRLLYSYSLFYHSWSYLLIVMFGTL